MGRCRASLGSCLHKEQKRTACEPKRVIPEAFTQAFVNSTSSDSPRVDPRLYEDIQVVCNATEQIIADCFDDAADQTHYDFGGDSSRGDYHSSGLPNSTGHDEGTVRRFIRNLRVSFTLPQFKWPDFSFIFGFNFASSESHTHDANYNNFNRTYGRSVHTNFWED